MEVEVFEKAKKPAYQVLAVVNFPSKQIEDFMSEVPVLGTYSEGG